MLRRMVAGAAIALAAALAVLGAHAAFDRFAGNSGLHPFLAIESKTYDWRLARTAAPGTARTDIALIEIDESSLRTLEPFAGRWPWPRAVHASLIDYLARASPKAIVYDVLFAGPDTRLGFKYGEATYSGAESDQELADSVKRAGNVIVMVDASYDRDTGADPVRDAGYPLDVPGTIERGSIQPPYPALAQAAAALGHNLFNLDPDGVMRHIVPFVRSRHVAVPSAGVAAALQVAGIAPADVALDGMSLRLGDRLMPLSAWRIKSSTGFDQYLWSLINFRGPALLADLRSRTYPTYSFFDVLRSQEQLDGGGTPDVPLSAFHDKIVFVGSTASGLFDVFETPFSNGRMPGINVHAAVTDDILSNRFMRPAPDSVRWLSVLAAALLVGGVAVVLPAWWATAATIVFLALVAWISTRMLAAGYWVNLSEPVLGSAFALFGGVAYQYFVEGRETRKMKRLFGQYVSRDVYEQLVARPELARLGGQRRDMTVLFSDIRGFTTVTERAEPEETVAMLNEYFTRMVEIVFRHQGTVDKFVGDMVMALFGAPLDDPQHADHAVEAALDMIDELRRLNERWQADRRFAALDIGVGINSGPMIAGNIGSDAIMSYTVIGDAVNLASRLESLNKQYGTRIIVSDATRERLTGRYTFRSLGVVVVKGKSHPVSIFEVVGRVAAASSRVEEAPL